MERTQIYFLKDEKEKLLNLAKEKGVTMAEVVREAVSEYLVKERKTLADKLSEAQGIWSDREEIKNSDDYISHMRKNWSSKEGE